MNADGALELLVASNDGKLSCFSTHARAAQTSRFRERRAENRGDLGNVSLGWKLAPVAPTPVPQPAKGELDKR